MAGLIDAIINPAQTDVLGALDKGRERQATDMVGDILSQTMGGKIGALAQLSPERAIELSNILGTTGKGRTDKMVGNAIMASQLIDAGQFDEAAAIFDEDIQALGGLGIDVSRSIATRDGILNRDASVIDPLQTFANQVDPTKQVSALDQAKTSKFNAEAAALGGKGKHPKSIVKNLSAPIKQRAIEAFNLAGGGKDGVKAMNAQIELDRTTTQRDDVPALLTASFPNANEAELQQLQATVDGSKSVDAGLKAADKVRSEQRRLVKAEIFQLRAVRLLDGILDNPELNDVLGSVEGTDKGFFFGKQNLSDGESTAIADIEEVSSILTADNLKLMSGVLSESDIKLLIALSAGSLNRTRGEARFIKDATELRDRLKSVLVQPLGGGDQTKKNRLEELRAKAGR